MYQTLRQDDSAYLLRSALLAILLSLFLVYVIALLVKQYVEYRVGIHDQPRPHNLLKLYRQTRHLVHAMAACHPQNFRIDGHWGSIGSHRFGRMTLNSICWRSYVP